MRSIMLLSVFLTFFCTALSAQSQADQQYQKAVKAIQTQSWNIALDALELCLKQDSKYIQAWISKGVVHMQLKEYDTALEMFGKALGLQPGNAIALYNRALVRALQGDFSGSMKDLNMALDKSPDHAPAYYNRAMLHLHFQDTLKALIDIALCLKYDPDFLQAYLLKASLHAHAGHLGQSQDAYAKALHTDSLSVHARFNRAHLLYKQGAYSEALPDFQYLHARFPENPLIRIHLGGVLYMLGQKPQACEAWKASDADLNAAALYNRYCK
jgi:tetratricopeptide (TPR) repeat protein